MQKFIRILFMIILDIFFVNASYLLALYLRFDGYIEPFYLKLYLDHAVVLTIIMIIVNYIFRLYKSIWRYASIDEMFQVVLATIVGTALIVSYFTAIQVTFSRYVYVVAAMFICLFVGGTRLSYRIVRRFRHKFDMDVSSKRVMIIGAGDAGAVIIRELQNHTQLNSKPVVIIDDDKSKEGSTIYRVPILGQRKDISFLATKMKIDEIIIAIPSASRQTIREIVDECRKTHCSLKTLPGIYELIDGKIDVSSIRNVQIEDLLGREVINLDSKEMAEYISGKVILITGGGGSIGSELARQIAMCHPRELVLLDIYENNVYDLQNELRRKYCVCENNDNCSEEQDKKYDFKLRVIIASVRDQERINEVFADVRPNVVFHAAAHKHVPLMEHNPKEAVKNNIFGTLNVARAASDNHVKKFVLISTDKAVNPTNIMGATKRMCEMIIQAIDRVSETEFALVRFGNVLGSNGSVVPLFQRQIAEQGYVTVTHPDIIRYFMTIPEAARLVIQAGAMAKGGEIFILDMGDPVKIVDLARDIIRLSGYEPDTDIPIRFTGLRPGEKLYEELLMDEESLKSTRHEKIFIGKPIDIDYNSLLEILDELADCVRTKTDEQLRQHMQVIVPTYRQSLSDNNYELKDNQGTGE